MPTVYIYALVHPKTKEIRYVGKANNLRSRLMSHIRDARRRDRPVCNWINKVIREGLAPEMIVLEECSAGNWEESEIRWIAELRKSGRLLNVADGGDCPKSTKEQLANAGRRCARFIHDDPERKRIWKIKQNAGYMLKWLEQNSSPERVERFKASMRYAAMKKPDVFGKWAAV